MKPTKHRITLISDTHTKHEDLRLPGGDILIHSGDIMNSGRDARDIKSFLNWFESQDYKNLIFIAGNHDRMFENHKDAVSEFLEQYPLITYLEDNQVNVDGIKIYGSPWQPEFYNWAFNFPRNGKELEDKWKAIPDDVDILITHGPPQGHLDTSGEPWNKPNLGCELLRKRIGEIKPKIHVFGHIHGSHGYKEYNGTHFFNASVLNESYQITNNGMTIDWDSITNELNFVN
jgi:Icc-related predicted phosphoesterase